MSVFLYYKSERSELQRSIMMVAWSLAIYVFLFCLKMLTYARHYSAPSDARKRGSGGGSARKSDDPPAGRLDLSKKHHMRHPLVGNLPDEDAEREEAIPSPERSETGEPGGIPPQERCEMCRR
jgi:hypothetical protein